MDLSRFFCCFSNEDSLVMLLLFVLAFLFGLFLGKMIYSRRLIRVQSDLDECRERGKAAEEVILAMSTKVQVANPYGWKVDDLKVIEGIGPKVEELMHKAGIQTWKQLAGLTTESCREILNTGGERFRILNPKSWPKQAGLLADGKWDEFKQYADYLINGVDPAENEID